jgi:hypothetical protein
MRIYDARFKYTPAMRTNVVATWERFGFRPTTDAERQARQRRRYSGTKNAAAPAAGREPNNA